jgi:Rad3-related DNA helicase
MSIFDSFPKGYSPRANQYPILEQIEANWDKADVFVVDAPVASGKSHIALTVASHSWKAHKHKASILAPNNMLVRQYTDQFPYLPTVGKQGSYSCNKYVKEPRPLSCKREKQLKGYFCKDCPYIKDLRKVQAYPLGVTNYHACLAYKNYRPTMIMDEAHYLQSIIADGASLKLWHHDYEFPSWVADYRSLYRWVCTELSRPEPKGSITKLVALKMELESNRTRYLFTKGSAMYHKEERECILVSPVDISEEPPLFWPKKVRKIFLLSATINSRDVRELGLSKRRVYYVKSPSPIPKENRPFIVEGANMSYRYQDTNLPKLIAYIRRLLETKESKGFIHAPYALARKLELYLGDHPRLLFHSAASKMDVFREFQASTNKVMVGSGMYEGISLDEDMARWQLICKVPWPSLSEPAMEYLCKEDPEFYASRTVKDLVQTYGRVCRSPTDYGETYCFDTSVERLFRQHNHLFPSWFREAYEVRTPIMEAV